MGGFATTIREKHECLLELAAEAYAAVEANERTECLARLSKEVVAHHVALQEAIYSQLYVEVGKRGKFAIEKLIEQEGLIGYVLKMLNETDANEMIWLVRLDILVDLLVSHYNAVEYQVFKRVKKHFNKAGRENLVRGYYKECNVALGNGPLEMSEEMLDEFREAEDVEDEGEAAADVAELDVVTLSEHPDETIQPAHDADEDAAPADEDAAPADEDAAPADEDAAPADEGASPAQEDK